MTRITTHVLDTAAGRPAPGLTVTLLRAQADGELSVLGTGVTDGDGRVSEFPPVAAGKHQLVFATGTPFFPEVIVTIQVGEEDRLHVPLLLSPFGYSVYRGS